MNKRSLNKLMCPISKGTLILGQDYKMLNGEVISGTLLNEQGDKYLIAGGIPDLITKDDLIGDAIFARKYYASIAKSYDDNVEVTFKLYNESESDIRCKMIDLLDIKPESKILEVSAGTGKDSEIIASRLNEKGELFCLDISPDMLQCAKQKKISSKAFIEFISGSACNLPFKDKSFDALFCFAGVGHFPDLKIALSEMARVVKVGGKVVFSEKHVPLWLRNTEYGKILINNNPMFAYDDPLKYIPVCARNLGIRWINGNVHYVVDFEVGEEEPKGNFDLELPGVRGGSFNTRFYGKLEGVTPSTKKLAIMVQEKLGISMHKWLDALIKNEAEKILSEK